MEKLHIPKKAWYIAALSAVCIGIAAAVALFYAHVDKNYNEAQALVEQGKYEEALQILEELELNYKDRNPLITYCEAHISYENGGDIEDIYYDMDMLIWRFNYQTTEMRQEIIEFKKKTEDEYNNYKKELRAAKAKEEYQASQASRSTPTPAPTAAKSTPTPVPTAAKSTPTPTAGNSLSGSSSSSSSSKKKAVETEDDDPYNASEYKNEDDFYEDHYYDFFDYYDAENYYRKHH